MKFGEFPYFSLKIREIALFAPRAPNGPVAAGWVLFSRFGKILSKNEKSALPKTLPKRYLLFSELSLDED